MYEIRSASAADILAVAEFQTVAWNDAYSDLVPAEYLARVTLEVRAERWGIRIREGQRSVLLAEDGQRIVGVVSFGSRSDDLPGPALELMSLYVAPDMRSRGLGSRLIEASIGFRPAVLWVFRDNTRAIDFYCRAGFLLDGYESVDDDTGLHLIRLSKDWDGPRAQGPVGSDGT